MGRWRVFWLEPTEEMAPGGHRLFIAVGGERTGEKYTLAEAPVGAMWDASWYRREGHDAAPLTGPDGLCLVVRLPFNHDWQPDCQASNCTRQQWVVRDGMRQWGERSHWCWVRHGDPRTGDLHVDKSGETCSAGAGSIQTGRWHGYLHHNFLSESG